MAAGFYAETPPANSTQQTIEIGAARFRLNTSMLQFW
jgi:hypothetical protein